MTMMRASPARESLEFGASALDLVAAKMSDDRDVAQVPGERLPRHALRRVEPDERRAGDAQHGLEVLG